MYKNAFCLPKSVSVPLALYKSEQGKYFDGCSGDLVFTGAGANAWAGLFNPPDSGVDLHVNGWTATSLYSDFRVQIWFNPMLPGRPFLSENVSAANLTLTPQPLPRVRLLYASCVKGEPEGGVTVFSFRGGPQNTIHVEENGKFIFPPGGAFVLVLSHPEDPAARAEGRAAFGWWEEPHC